VLVDVVVVAGVSRRLVGDVAPARFVGLGMGILEGCCVARRTGEPLLTSETCEGALDAFSEAAGIRPGERSGDGGRGML
jgi:hypothetical protein